MTRRLLLLLVVLAVVAGACGRDDDTAETTSAPGTAAPTTMQETIPPTTGGAPETVPPTTAVPVVAEGADFRLGAGLGCADLVATEAPYPVAVAYFVQERLPAALDPDGNGIPCEDVYPAADVAAYFAPAEAAATGQFCRDLHAAGAPYSVAVAYWLGEGAPDRMDADLNGIPCETVYPADEIGAFYPARSTAFTATRPPFGDFTEVPLLGDTPAYAGPATPTSLDGVRVSDVVAAELDAAATTTLTELGFVVVPSDDRLMHHPYERAQYGDTAVYVTTDAAFHYWHLALSKVLRDAEEQVMLPALEDLVAGLLDAAEVRSAELAGTPSGDSADRVVQYLEAAATLLELEVGTVGPLAAEEVALAIEHSATGASPTLATGECEIVTGFRCVYYGLFKPRGHYTRSADLERYFRAMSLFGNAGVMLFDSSDPRTASVDVESVRRGLILADLLASDPDLVALWQTVYEPTAFLVGNADDYTPLEAAAAAEATGHDLGDPAVLGSEQAIEEIAAAMLDARRVSINVPMTSLRVMGSRFVIDSYILDQLPLDNDGFFASGLDVANVFGSSQAEEIRETDPNLPESYVGRADTLEADLATRRVVDWAATVYDAWLYALQAVWADHGAAFPDYMRTEAWHAKDLQTGLGSYAELKHDTILYAKQRTAQGDFPWAPDRANWVEPDPVVYGRLAEVAAMLHEGMAARGLIASNDRLDVLVTELRRFLDTLEEIAVAELAGTPLTQEQGEFLAAIGPTMEMLYLLSADEGDLVDQDAQAAIIADVYTGQYGILEVATGRIDHLFVMVPNAAGEFEVAVGGVYSYYEFKGARETDEEWRAMLDAGTAPPRLAWQEVFLAG